MTLGPNAIELTEVARRVGLPASWLASVMLAESNGDAAARSPKGAIGLMQLMPSTYAEMRRLLGLGADPWRPADNLLAGAAYLRLLTERYGASGALAAYNAGPGRYERWLAGVASLPSETRDYVARVRSGPAVRKRLTVSAPRSVQMADPRASPLFVGVGDPRGKAGPGPEPTKKVQSSAAANPLFAPTHTEENRP